MEDMAREAKSAASNQRMGQYYQVTKQLSGKKALHQRMGQIYQVTKQLSGIKAQIREWDRFTK